MNKKIILAILAAFIVVLGAAFVLWYRTPKGYSGKMEPINLATVPTVASALIYIAQDRHFFAANGLSVTVKDYATGIATSDALLRGEVEVAWSAEFALVRRAFQEQKISIFASISRFTTLHLFARRDRGTEKISDLKGGKIGVPRNTICEFYLTRFLVLNGVNPRDVSFVDIQPEQALQQITDGGINWVVTYESYSAPIRTQLAGKIIEWPIQSSQPGYGVISARKEWVSGNRKLLVRFLKSLALAEDYLARNTEPAKAIVQARLNDDRAKVESLWPGVEFFLSLDQSLITAMQDEARWMIKNNLTKKKQVPDFVNYIYVDGLKAIKPEAVSIIR